MKVLFCTNLPSPYRVEFFNEFGKMCDLTVCYERRSSSERDDKWKAANARSFEEVYLDLVPVGADRSKGRALQEYIAAHRADILVLTNYVSPASMKAIFYCKKKGIPYWIEYDGGSNTPDVFYKRILKKLLLCKAQGHLTTSDVHIKYLQTLGISKDRIFKYPFTSVLENDIRKGRLDPAEKIALKQKWNIIEETVIVSVGRFNYENGRGKGFDLLFQIAEHIDPSIGIYIIGDEPMEEFVQWKEEKSLNQIHFIPFKEKKDLFQYYLCADLLVLLTRGDVWGLVVNEAMACGLPVLTSDHCVAGTELIEHGVNGYLVPAGSYKEAEKYIDDFFGDEKIQIEFSEKCIEKIKNYTIEKMAERHIEIFKSV